jgi:putative hemolysin
VSPFEEDNEHPNISRVRALLRRATSTSVSLTVAGFISFATTLLLFFLVIYRAAGLADAEPYWLEWLISAVLLVILSAFIIFIGHTMPLMQFAYPEFIIKNATSAGLITSIMYPMSTLLVRTANLLGRAKSIPEALGVEDFEVYSTTAPVENDLEEEEREMISAIVEMGDTTVRDVMTPRIDIIALDADDPPSESISVVLDAPFSRFPVYEGTIDNVIGVLHIRHLMVDLKKHPESVDIRQLAQETIFAPESMRVGDLLRELRQQRRHMAIVTDEYGGTAGLATIEDIIEEIVGEIQDEYDDEAQDIYRKEDGSFVVNVGLPVEEFNEGTGLSLDDEGNDTVGGLLYSKFGKIPDKGDVVHINGVKFTVLRVDKNRIVLALVEISE